MMVVNISDVHERNEARFEEVVAIELDDTSVKLSSPLILAHTFIIFFDFQVENKEVLT